MQVNRERDKYIQIFVEFYQTSNSLQGHKRFPPVDGITSFVPLAGGIEEGMTDLLNPPHP